MAKLTLASFKFDDYTISTSLIVVFQLFVFWGIYGGKSHSKPFSFIEETTWYNEVHDRTTTHTPPPHGEHQARDCHSSHYEHNHKQRTNKTCPWQVQCTNKSTHEEVERQWSTKYTTQHQSVARWRATETCIVAGLCANMIAHDNNVSLEWVKGIPHRDHTTKHHREAER
jgi:hypothetical protein